MTHERPYLVFIANENEEILALKTTPEIAHNDAHFNVLKQIEWPKLTIIAIKEFYETIASHSN